MHVKAKGQLRHQFFGTYSAVIALCFDDGNCASEALPKLGAGWYQSEKNSAALVWTGNFEELEACKAVLGSFGADVKKIDSIAKNIDYGETFAIVVEIIPREQLSMF